MDLKSTNNIGDMMLVSCGNDDDSRILIHDLASRTVVKEIRKENYGFYNMNLIVFEREDDANDEDNFIDLDLAGENNGQGDGRKSRSRSRIIDAINVSNPSVSQIFQPDKILNTNPQDNINVNLSDVSYKWKTEGIAIVVAGITNVKLFVYDYVEKMIALEEDLDVFGDIGSYLNVMELVKK